MIQAAISLFILGLVAFFLGANNIAGVTMELGRTLLLVFVVLSAVSFLSDLYYRNRTSRKRELP